MINKVKPAEMRILVVDDQPQVLTATARLLAEAGYTVNCADSGAAALASAREHHPHLVLLDRDMPGMAGLEVCRAIRADPALAGIFVIFVSGVNVASEEKSEGLESGADGYITRPIANREFLARVDAHVRILFLNRSLQQHVAELQQSRRAALNLVEEAQQAREQLSATNRDLQEKIAEARRSEAAMVASEARYRRLFEAAKDGILMLHAETGRIMEVNPFLVDLLGYPREKFIGQQLWELGVFKDIAANQANFTELQAKDYVRYDDLALETSAGRRVEVEFISNAYQVDGSRVIQCNIRDITERKSHEEERERLNRLYATLSRVNHSIVRVQSREDLFAEVCHSIVEFGGFKFAWIGCHNPVTQQVLPVAHAGAASGYLDQIKVYADDRPEGHGPGGTCIRTNQAVILNRFLHTAAGEPWRDAARIYGLRAAASFPIHYEGRVWGQLAVYDEKEDAFQDREIALLTEATDDISFGMEHLEMEARRAQAETNLTAEKKLLRTLVDHLPVAVYLKDTAGRKTLANPVDLRNQGVTSETEIRGKTDFEVFAPAAAAIYDQDDQQVLQGQPVLNREEKLTRPDGSIAWLLTSKVPLRDATGQVTGLAGIGLDITERKRLEEDHERLAAAVEQASDTIVITDPAGTIVYVNPAFEKSSGYTRAEAVGQNTRLLKSGKQDSEFYRQMWDVLQHGEVWSGHFINQRKDGALYEEDATISAVRDPEGKTVNYVAVKRDVTREMQLEAQFRQMQKMEGIGQLAGGVAHDFNNILAVIQMQVGLLRGGGNLEPDQAQYADEINHTVDRAAALTRQLLLFSRRETPQSRDLDLSNSITNTMKMLRRILGENIEVQTKLAAQPLLVHADPVMLDQVLLNLAVNARDAMANGGRLLIETTGVEIDAITAAQNAQARPGRFVCLSVGDTGTGISPEILPRIFEPFFTTKDVGKGTGLGLATVFGIVQQHHGWIQVSSTLGHGTTFQIYLPRLARWDKSLIGANTTAVMPTGTETILLVEDEAALRTTLKISLARLGYRILEAANGVKALEVRQAHPGEIHLLLTDLMMPEGLTGKALGQRLLQENPQLKVIYMSGYSPEMIGKDFPLQAGVNFLIKPFSTQKLAQIIRAVLDNPTGEGHP